MGEKLVVHITSRPRYRLFLAVSYLLWASVTLRWIMEYIEQGHPLTWLISAMLLLNGILLGLEPVITAGSAARAHLYLVIQTLLVFTASLFYYELDYFAILLLPLCGQAVYLLPRRQSIGWVGVLLGVMFIGQWIQFGGASGLPFFLLYAAGLVFVAAFSDQVLKTEAAREESESLLHELQEAHRKLQEYAGQAERLAVADERNRLARDLHDSVAQTMYGLTLQAEAAARKLEAGEGDTAANYLRQIRQSAQQMLVETRMLIFDLRPLSLEQSGLAAAIRARLEAVESRSGIQVFARIEDIGRLPDQVENHLYRIALEALNNSLRHASATQVSVSLTRLDGLIELLIDDDGIGFDSRLPATQRGMGVSGMRERAEKIGAQLIIESKKGEGVKVHVEVPV
jgi:signal transduction histidine kinase